ncbi:MAG: hypothetical protein V4635_06265 [Bacteroidota bacterium]
MKNQYFNYEDLEQRIGSLKENCEKQEAQILNHVSELYAITKDPVHYISEVACNLAEKKDFKTNLLKIGLNLGTDYLYRMVSRRGRKASAYQASNETQDRSHEETEGNNENGVTDLITEFLLKLGRKTG